MDRRRFNLAWVAKHHFECVRWTSFVVFVSPAVWLLGEWWAGAMGINPLSHLLRFTGTWAVVMLSVTLSVTPLRRLSVWVSRTVHARYGKRVSDWNGLVRLRRQFGLFTFFYAGAHASAYVAFDVGLDLAAIRDDILERPFILVGVTAFALLIPLAVTSNRHAIRALGSSWRRLHLLVYVVALLAIAHFWMQAKLGDNTPLPYTVVLLALLATRWRAWQRGERSTAGEVPERPGAASRAGRVAPAALPARPMPPSGTGSLR